MTDCTTDVPAALLQLTLGNPHVAQGSKELLNPMALSPLLLTPPRLQQATSLSSTSSFSTQVIHLLPPAQQTEDKSCLVP